MRASRVLAVAFLLFVPGIPSTLETAFGGPSHESPAGGISVRSVEPNQTLFRKAMLADTGARETLLLMQQAEQENRLGKLKPTFIGEAYAHATHLKRLSEELILVGETAGVDFEFRAELLRDEIRRIANLYARQPGMSAIIQKQYQLFLGESKKRKNVLDPVTKLTEQKEWNTAEKTLYDVLFRLNTMAVWYPPPRVVSAMTDYWKVRAVVDDGVDAMLRESALATLTQQREAATPQFDSLLAAVRSAIETVGTTGEATVDEKSLTGPKLISHFSNQWQTAHLQTLQCQHMDVILHNLKGQPGSPSSDLLAEYADFCGQMSEEFAGLIEADAQRVNESEARDLYIEYLSSLAPVVSRYHDDSLHQTVSKGLKSLIGKSAALGINVDAYRVATQEMLRWRQRTAAAMSSAAKADSTSIETVFLDAVRSESDWRGLVSSKAPDTNAAMLLTSVPKIMPTATERLLGKSAVQNDLPGLGKSKPVAIGRYNQRHYSQVIAPTAWANQVQSLRADLLLKSAEDRPLTLEAAVALSSANRGDMEAMGGKIAGFYLESVTGRFATLSASGGCLLPLGKFEAEPATNSPLKQVMMRFKMEPDWVQHRYFFLASP